MIGNDIVDLALARQESNWERKGFLNKIFTNREQILIKTAQNPEIMVWNLWSRKEAIYKIYNRQTGFRGFIPLQLECHFENENRGTVSCNGFTYYTKTTINNEFVYTIAVAKKENFKKIVALKSASKIKKENGKPIYIDALTEIKMPASISHHGRFMKCITI